LSLLFFGQKRFDKCGYRFNFPFAALQYKAGKALRHIVRFGVAGIKNIVRVYA